MIKRIAIGVLALWFGGTALAQTPFPRPMTDAFDASTLDRIDLTALPIIPEMTETGLAIYAAGQALGNHADRFSKIGDCMTASAQFLTPYGEDGTDLGEYAELAAVVEHFDVPARDEGFALNSFTNSGLGTASGFNTSTLTDPLFADPKWCDANESSLACEYRVTRPAFALIMLGTNDVMFFEASDFDLAMRNIVLDTIEGGIVPVLYTFPRRPEYPEKVDVFNKVIARIAADYDVPLVNLWLAIEDLPDHGVYALDPIHLSEQTDTSTGDLTADNLMFGYPMRNLITLQTLDGLLKALEDVESGV